MANPRGELLLRCGRHQPVPLWQTLFAVSLGSAAFVTIGGLITGYWGLMLGTVVLMVAPATPIFLFMSRPISVYENGIAAGSFRRWNEVAAIHLWEYGTVSVMQRRTMSLWGKFEEAVEFQVPPECVDELHAVLQQTYPGPLKRFETGPL